MQPIPLTQLTQGINRLRVKGGASAQSLYDLVNAYITNDGSIQQREGTINVATLTSSTTGLFSFGGTLNTCAITNVSVPSGFEVNVLINPVNPALTIETIWFAQPFMGFPYIVAQFSDGSVYHYWLQNNGTWAADTVYDTGTLILPTTPTGLAYLATSTGYITSAAGTTALTSLPVWTAQTAIAEGYTVQPTTYTGYVYRAVAVAGSAPHTGSSEPAWPTTSAATIQEFGDFDTTSTDSGTNEVTTPTLGTSITDRYGDSGDVAGQTGTTDLVASTVVANTTVTTWAAGTTYAPGAVVQPSTSQGAFINAIPNGDFENGNDGNWVLGTGWTIGTSAPYQGNDCAEYSGTGAGNFYCTMDTGATVAPGTSVTATCYAEGDSQGAVYIQLNWYNSGNTLISSTLSSEHSGGGGTNPSGYSLIGVTGSAPAGTATVKVAILYTTGSHSARAGRADLVLWNLETPAAVSNFLYEAIQAAPATSGSTEPAWPTVDGNTVIDGGVTWQALGTSIITWEAIPIMQSASFSSIATFDAPTAGTGYVTGTYNNVPLTGGTGTGATALVTVNGSGHVSAVTLISGGEGYLANDVLSAANGNLGGSGSGFSVEVATIVAGAGEPTFPTTVGISVVDPSTFTASDSAVINTSITWTAVSRVVTDVNNPQTVEVCLGASHVFAGNNDIVAYSAAVNPTDWTSSNNAGYLPTGLNNYGANPVTAIGLYRSNLIVFNSNGYQMWEIDPDPANMALLDAEPVGCPYTRSLQSVANDLLLLTEVGVRNIGLAGATANMQVGNTGQPVDPLVVAQIAAATYTPISLYYPGRGQYWLIFGPQAFVLTINGNGNRTWSRYTFPAAITDWTIQDGTLYLRTVTNLVWEFSAAAEGVDDESASNTAFVGLVQTPYLDMQGLGINKMLIGLDLVGTGAVGIQIGFDQADVTTFSDNAGFSGSANVTPVYNLAVDDTVPGEPIPLPINAPSLTLILAFAGNQAWSLQASNFYVQGQSGAGATG